MEKSITLTREQLYEQVWSMPMSRLAVKYQMSDVALAKHCKKHNIPRPPRGHWAKLEFGKSSPQEKLPNCKDERLSVITLVMDRPEPQVGGGNKSPATRPAEPVFDQEIQELIKRAQERPAITVSNQLIAPHPMVLVAKLGFIEAVKKEPYYRRPIFWPVSVKGHPSQLSIEVGADSVHRALCLMNAFIKEVEAIGGNVRVDEYKKFSYESTVGTLFIFAEEIQEIRLRERVRREVKDPKSKSMFPDYNYYPSGDFILDTGGDWNNKILFRDSHVRLESKLKDIVLWFIRNAGLMRLERRRKAAEESARAEQLRVAREDRATIKKQHDELKSKQDAERNKLQQLFDAAEAWQKSQILRAYIKVVANSKGIDSHWQAWANEHADRLDPLTISPYSILDESLPRVPPAVEDD